MASKWAFVAAHSWSHFCLPPSRAGDGAVRDHVLDGELFGEEADVAGMVHVRMREDEQVDRPVEVGAAAEEDVEIALERGPAVEQTVRLASVSTRITPHENSYRLAAPCPTSIAWTLITGSPLPFPGGASTGSPRAAVRAAFVSGAPGDESSAAGGFARLPSTAVRERGTGRRAGLPSSFADGVVEAAPGRTPVLIARPRASGAKGRTWRRTLPRSALLCGIAVAWRRWRDRRRIGRDTGQRRIRLVGLPPIGVGLDALADAVGRRADPEQGQHLRAPSPGTSSRARRSGRSSSR